MDFTDKILINLENSIENKEKNTTQVLGVTPRLPTGLYTARGKVSKQIMKEIKQETNTVDYNGMIDSPLYQ